MDENIKNTLLPNAADIDDEQDDHDDDQVEEIEAYCVKCKHSVVMESPEAVWTI